MKRDKERQRDQEREITATRVKRQETRRIPLVVIEITRHGHDMILDIAQVEADFRPRRHLPLFIASFGESLDDVRFMTQQSIQAHDLLATIAHPSEQVPSLAISVGRLSGLGFLAAAQGRTEVGPRGS